MNYDDEGGDALPISAIIATPLGLLPWLVMLAKPGFPIGIVIALAGVVSAFVVGVIAYNLFLQREVSAAHRFSLKVCLVYFGIVGVLIFFS